MLLYTITNPAGSSLNTNFIFKTKQAKSLLDDATKLFSYSLQIYVHINEIDYKNPAID